MKTLILSGTVKNVGNKCVYDLCLFGQTAIEPLCTVITYKIIECSGYSEMQDIVRNIFADYYKTDLFNIISIEHITPIN
jgi:hypothetical protein